MSKCKNLLESCNPETIQEVFFNYGHREFLSRYESYELWPNDLDLRQKDLELWQGDVFIGPDLTSEQEDQFTDLLFEYQNLCWNCAKSFIESRMSWRFELVQYGIQLQEQSAFLEIVDSSEKTKRWTELLCWLYKRDVGSDEFVDLVACFNSYEVTPDGVKSMCEWVEDVFETTISREEIEHLLHLGYSSVTELQHLEHGETIDRGLLSAPSANLLRSLDWDIVSLYRLEKCLELLHYDIDRDDDFETYVRMLSETKVVLTELEPILTALSVDEELSVIDVLYDGYLFDPTGRHIALALVDTLRSMREVNVALTEDNLLAYWSLTPSQILHVIDNDIDDFEEILPFRFFKEPSDIERMRSLLPLEIPLSDTYRLTCAGYDDTSLAKFNQHGISHEVLISVLATTNGIQPEELFSWIDAGFSLARLGEILDWRDSKFNPQEAKRWEGEGFDSAAAKLWRDVVDDPSIAARRLRAGITPITPS